MYSHTPALVKCTDKQQYSFQKIFLKDARDLSISLNSTEPVKDFHEKRSQLRKMARGLLDVAEKEKRTLTESESDAFTVCTALMDDIQEGFDRRSELDRATHAVQQTDQGNNTKRSLDTWKDVKSGKLVPVLGPEHRFTDHVQRGYDEFSTREYWTAIAGHKVSSEVRSAMGLGNDIKGGFLTLPEFVSADVIDLMRAKNVLVQSGARTIPLPAENCRICKVDSDPQASWVPENSLIPDTDMSIGAIDFFSHKLTTLMKISRELIQDAGNAGSVIMNGIANAMALELDSAGLLGDGNGKPLGIFNNPGINTYSLGTDGATLSGYDDLLYGIREIVNVNGPIPSTAIMAPRSLIDYSLQKDGEGLPLVRPDLIKNMTFLDTTKVPVNQEQGASGNVCSAILLGGFDQLVIGIRSVLEIQVLMEKFADYGQVGYLATMRVDTALYQPKSICKIMGIKPSV